MPELLMIWSEKKQQTKGKYKVKYKKLYKVY